MVYHVRSHLVLNSEFALVVYLVENKKEKM